MRNKKQVTLLLACSLIILSGCSRRPKEDTTTTNKATRNPTAASETTATETPVAASPVTDAVEGVLPVDEVQSFVTMDTFNNYLAENSDDDARDPDGTGYSSNAVLIEKNGKYGFADYSGNALMSPTLESANQYSKYLYGFIGDDGYSISYDYTTLTYTELGFGGMTGRELYVKDGTLGYMDSGGGYSAGTPTNPTKNMILAMATTGTASVAPNGSSVLKTMDGYFCCDQILSNSYVFLLDEKEDCTKSYRSTESIALNHHEHTGKLALFNASTGTNITGFVYEDAGYVSDGYAPAKQNGSWGYINEKGSTVISPMFEEATSVYNGKAYVKYAGMWILIDVAEFGKIMETKETSEALDELSAYVKEHASDAIQTGIVTIHTKEEVQAESGEAPDESDSTTGGDTENSTGIAKISMGEVTVLVDGLNIRSSATTSGESLGKATAGSTYDVYSIVSSDGYTWYQIETDQWIADNGSWCTYTPTE